MNEHKVLDVVIIGAGISGIGLAHRIKQMAFPADFIVLESLPSVGGTWLVHKYPGARSDSDFFTFGYSFKSWSGGFLADRESILKYLEEVSIGLREHMLFNHKVLSATWTDHERLWTITGRSDAHDFVFKSKFVAFCTGYYKYGPGYTPDFKGRANFKGAILHPQSWPDEVSLEGKKVVIIGSGASSATIGPTIAEKARCVTIIQRSPSYYIERPEEVMKLLEKLRLENTKEELVHERMRKEILCWIKMVLTRAAEEPDTLKHELVENIVKHFQEEGVESMKKHFTPKYNPWNQRMLTVDNSFFEAIQSGKLNFVTERISCFVSDGVALENGNVVKADVIITATGFGHFCVAGDIEIEVNASKLSLSDTYRYRGFMHSNIPNLFWMASYKYYPYTLRIEILSDVICKLFDYMKAHGYWKCTPIVPKDLKKAEKPPIIFCPGWVMRSLRLFPKEAESPWRLIDDYEEDKASLESITFETETCLKFEK